MKYAGWITTRWIILIVALITIAAVVIGMRTTSDPKAPLEPAPTTTERPIIEARWQSPDEYVVAPSTSTTAKRASRRRPSDPGCNLQCRQCESGNNYANTKNPTYRGAYQFDQQTWDRFASPEWRGKDPATAPSDVQDAAAEAVTYDAWPNC